MPGSRLAAWATLSLLVLCPAAGAAQEWKQKVDLLWDESERGGASDSCQAHLVRAVPPLLRGSTSNRGCIIRAIAASRDGDAKLANAWLRAGYCKNPVTRKAIQKAGDQAVEYAVGRYGKQVP